MRWVRRILMAISLVVALFGATVIVLLIVDLGRFKSNLEGYVSDATGRQFVIDGRFEPSIGNTVDVVAENVRLANANWGTAENILELERLVISIDTWSLLSGPIEILNLEVEGLTLHVEREPETLQSSWAFGDSPPVDDDTDEMDPSFALPLWLRQASLQHVDIHYGQGWMDEPRHLAISNARLSADGNSLLHMSMSGAIGDDPIRATGLMGPLSALLDGQGPRWELQVDVGDFSLSTDGTFHNLFTLEGPQIHAEMQGPLAERMLARFGLPALARGPVDLSADFTEGPNGIDLSIKGAFGDLTTEVVGRTQSLRASGDLDLSVEVHGPDLKAIGELFNAGFLPSTGFSVSGDVAKTGDILELQSIVLSAGDARLQVDGRLVPHEADPDAQLLLSASGPEIHDFLPATLAERIPSGAFKLQAIVAGGLQQPEFRKLTASLGKHELSIDGFLPAGADMAGLDVAITASGEDLQALLEPWLEIALPPVPFGIDGRITGSDGALQLSDVTYYVSEARGELDGNTGLLPSLNGLRLNASLVGPDANRFVELLDIFDNDTLLPADEFEARGTFSKTAAGWFVNPWVLRVGESQLELNGALGDFDDLSGIDIDVALSGPDLRRFLPNRDIDVSVPYEIDGGLRIGDTDIELKHVDIRVARATASLDGRLPIGAAMTNADFNIRVAVPNLERMGKAFNIGSLPPSPFRFEGAMSRAGQVYSVDHLIAEVGSNKIIGELAVEMGPRMRLTGRLNSEYLNLTELIEQQDDITDDAVARDRLIPDTPLPLQILDVADVDVQLRLGQLVTNFFDVGEIEFDVVIEDDELHVDASRMSLGNGSTLNVALDVVRTAREFADVRFGVIAEKISLRPPTDGDGQPIERPPTDLNLTLAASGRTVRELAASANGSISLREGKGEIDNDFSGFVMRDMFSQLLGAVNPLSKDAEYTQLNCAFVEIDVVDGIARSRAIGLQTDKLAMASVGTLNLATEALDLSFRVKQREGIGISLAGIINPYIKVGGTLASPALIVDKKRGLFTGAIAALTGGLSILAKGVWDRYLSQDDYCETVIEALESGEIPVWDGKSGNN